MVIDEFYKLCPIARDFSTGPCQEGSPGVSIVHRRLLAGGGRMVSLC